MNSTTERLYHLAPPWLQNVMVTAYGASIWNKRYAAPHDEHFQYLERNSDLSMDRIREIQWTAFRNVLAHSVQNVPYYKDLFRNNNLTLEDFHDFSDLNKIPILEKEVVRNDPGRLVAKNFDPKSLFVLHTSGTSGKALTIYCDKPSRRRHYAFWTQIRKQYGVIRGMKRATMFGRIICLPDQKKPPFWRYDAIGKNLLMSSYHLSAGHLPSYADKLVKYRPDEIIGYASSVFLLAKFVMDHPEIRIRPKLVVTTADKLLPHFRPVIEEAFKAPVVDQYGCAEMSIFAFQDPQGEYRVHPEHGILEVLDQDNNPARPGETGEAICTGFVNMAMPLIRYRLGDRISLPHSTDPDSPIAPTFHDIEGRVDDILRAPDGRPLGRFSPIWKVVDGIFETQVIQNSTDSLDIHLVVDPSFRTDEKNQWALEHEIRKRTGEEMSLTFHYSDSIPKDKNGKFKTVISNL